MHNTPRHSNRTARRTVGRIAAVVAIVGLPLAAYFGPRAVASTYAEHTSPTRVSYADADTVRDTLAGAEHTAATMGDFRDAASIETGDVVSVVRVVP